MPIKFKEQERILALACLLAPGFGPRSYQDLLSKIGSLENLANFLSDADMNLAKLIAYLPAAEALAKQLQIKQIQFVVYGESDYPHLLEILPDPPIVLFYKTELPDLPQLTDGLAIVGTRKAQPISLRLAEKFAYFAGNAGLSIVSGLALGVDAAAHAGGLRTEALNIAVMPTAIDVISPQSNAHLYKQILEQGGVIFSETYPGEVFHKGIFLRRNRILAGLTRATLLIEASAKSGALSAARHAFDYGRLVFALPGGAQDTHFAGNNMLIKCSQAQMVETVEDLAHELSFDTDSVTQNLSHKIASRLAGLADGKLIKVYQEVKSSPARIEDICVKMGLGVEYVLSVLVQLQVEGLISQNQYGFFHANEIL